ncbi:MULTISPECIES: protein translocase subunit SecD [Halorhodospira]|uniref:protein translocase subunit SecD n=1 Tax=Halorhodospira TaxID=85108 RepID=UPI0019127D70|nr:MULTISPECIES: protein translocase subunit SecD [Halorhodospira]MBK5937344.1 protein translocase subunit SecD [Halorhodospira halophila]MCG5533202.1 protein translocase subunit SecD [Halorhodospira sp. 9621]MCG5536955.1 protein translocase subunit SecD [Halorhodospira sp. 9622]MCG5539682.1 protein translocase subunit SecD [Halorhodospira sp. M39old]MCG5545492.1 protein translocase subunit SecD [Halorhodospira sp. M38]
MNRYPLWKYLLVVAVLVVGGLFALPNLFGEDPSVVITTGDDEVPSEEVQSDVLSFLEEEGYKPLSAEVLEGQWVLRYGSTDEQMRASDLISAKLDRDYSVAMTLVPSTPQWLRALGAEPMFLGLDLRGGVHFLLQVDIDAMVGETMEGHQQDIRTLFREERIRFSALEVTDEQQIRMAFVDSELRERARSALEEHIDGLAYSEETNEDAYLLIASMDEEELQEMKDLAVQQNITTLRNRVDELGVAEPVVQRQGADRIVVQLPGIQDPGQAKEILGATATLEFRFVDHANFPFTGDPDDPPEGAEVFPQRDGGYVALERQRILSGDRIIDASSGFDQESGSPEVNIRLSGTGGRIMNRATRDRVGDHMAVLFQERVSETEMIDGEPERVIREIEEVISVARIREGLGSRFRITGLDSSQEASNLALLLRAGALAAPIDIVEERTIGPSLGAENVERGFMAVVIGFLLVIAFMALYYRTFGLVANLALLSNLVIIVAVLSMLQATLTLPGIAGIVLTVGMAVDANVLIFQRIREELKAGAPIQTAIDAGYGKALSTIADANVTTLIAALVLFLFGTGPVQGFAVTLAIGLATSMFTAIVGTRAVINLIYGGRKVSELKI